MKCNVGWIDRAVRILLGAGIIAWGVAAGSWWGAVGLVPLLTGLAGRCCAYVPFGISTCETKDARRTA